MTWNFEVIRQGELVIKCLLVLMSFLSCINIKKLLSVINRIKFGMLDLSGLMGAAASAYKLYSVDLKS